jgi:transcriptional regulator with XRE-family HTH domain
MMQTPAVQWQMPLPMGSAMDDDQGDAGLRAVVAANLSALMRESRTLKTIEAVESRTAETGSKVGKSTVGRLKNGETPITLDKLAALAKAFGVEPWQFLRPNSATAGPPPDQWSRHAQELARLCDEELAPEDRAGLLSIAISSVSLIKAKRNQARAVAEAVADHAPDLAKLTEAPRH